MSGDAVSITVTVGVVTPVLLPDVGSSISSPSSSITTSGKRTGITTPTVTVIDTASPDNFLKEIEKYELELLEDFDQSWTQAAFKAVSGEAKRESREAFEKRLVLESPPLVDGLETVLRAVKDLAAWLCDKAENFRPYRFGVRLFLDVTPGSLNTFVALVPAYEKNLVSLEMMTDVNPVVSDAQRPAELARLKAQQNSLEANRPLGGP